MFAGGSEAQPSVADAEGPMLLNQPFGLERHVTKVELPPGSALSSSMCRP